MPGPVAAGNKNSGNHAPAPASSRPRPSAPASRPAACRPSAGGTPPCKRPPWWPTGTSRCWPGAISPSRARRTRAQSSYDANANPAWWASGRNPAIGPHQGFPGARDQPHHPAGQPGRQPARQCDSGGGQRVPPDRQQRPGCGAGRAACGRRREHPCEERRHQRGVQHHAIGDHGQAVPARSGRQRQLHGRQHRHAQGRFQHRPGDGRDQGRSHAGAGRHQPGHERQGQVYDTASSGPS
jgi:hypothetical protein